jgi:hypothetical protein
MKKHIDTLAISRIASCPGLFAGTMAGTIMLSLSYPESAIIGLAASVFLLPYVSSMLKTCRRASTQLRNLRNRSDCQQIAQKALSYFSFGFLVFGAMQVRLSVLPSVTHPIGTLLLPSSLLFCIVQAVFMGLMGARKILLDATRKPAS